MWLLLVLVGGSASDMVAVADFSVLICNWPDQHSRARGAFLLCTGGRWCCGSRRLSALVAHWSSSAGTCVDEELGSEWELVSPDEAALKLLQV